jgi:pimeloyl-ACP methyl ester carboxylesterase
MRARPFEIATRDGLTLRGESHPAGADWVLMVHDMGQDLDCWQPLVGPLNSAGFSVGAIDLRGHGASDGEPDESMIGSDLGDILSQARRDVPGTLVLVSAGGVGIMALTADLPGRPDAVIVFSPTPRRDSSRDLRGDGMAKLFLVGALDAQLDGAARYLRNRSLGQAGVISFPTDRQGADLLLEPWTSHAVEQVLGFVKVVASHTATTNPTGGRE